MAGSNIATNCIMNNRMTLKNRKLEYLKFAKYGNDMWSFYLSIMLHYVSAKTVYFDHLVNVANRTCQSLLYAPF